MEYDHIYNLTCSLTQTSRRNLILTHLEQAQTYAGMIEGTPNQRHNDWEIETDLRHAAQLQFTIGEPHLIPPLRRDYLHAPGDMEAARERTSRNPKEWGRDPEWLPLVRCIGCFSSNTTKLNSTKHISVLTILWYQDDFAMPIDQNILQILKSLDWESLATDVEL